MKKIFAVILTLTALVSLASCSWWTTTPIEGDRLPDPIDGTGGNDTTTEPTGDTDGDKNLPQPDDTDGFAYLGEGLQFFHATTGDCVIVYNDKNAWAFDYQLRRVTPLVDFDAMLDAADSTGRGVQYFEDVTLSVGCEMVNEREIRIILTVNSSTDEASYAVSCYYVLNDEIAPYVRGEVRGYYPYFDITYPGYDEPVVIGDVEDWGELFGHSQDYTESWLYQTVKAFLEVDTAKLEEVMNVEEGTLRSWQGTAISDYTIIRFNPTNSYFDEVTIRFTLAEGSLGRWHSDWMGGQYEVTISDGAGQFMRISPVNVTDTDIEPTGAEEFITHWVSSYGGWYPLDDQVVENSGFMHHLIDFYLSDAYERGEETSYEGYVEFCEDTFGLQNVAAHVSRDEVENHGGHGGSTALCDVELEAQSGNNYIFKVTFWADVTESVPAKYYEIHVTDRGSGEYTVTDVRCTLDNGFGVYAWTM